jgi:hypothetical protein
VALAPLAPAPTGSAVRVKRSFSVSDMLFMKR